MSDTHQGAPFFERAMQVLLPKGGYVTALVEAYFDESGTHEGSDVLCVAGYIFERDAALALTSSWQSMLEEKGLPYFHMCECAPCEGIYSHLTMPECDGLARRAFALIREHMTYGYAITIETQCAGSIPTGGHYSSLYTFACWMALIAVRNWANEAKYQGEIAYFFEAGHASQGETNAIFERLFRHRYMKLAYRPAGLTFAEKAKAVLLQCADVYAWQSFVSRKRLLRGEALRKDYIALVDDSRHFVSHYGSREMEDFAAQVSRLGDSSDLLLPHGWADVMEPNGLGRA